MRQKLFIDSLSRSGAEAGRTPSPKGGGQEELSHVRGQGQRLRVPDCDGAGTAKRSYPTSKVGGAAKRRYPARRSGAATRGVTLSPRSGAVAGRSYPTPLSPRLGAKGGKSYPTPEARVVAGRTKLTPWLRGHRGA